MFVTGHELKGLRRAYRWLMSALPQERPKSRCPRSPVYCQKLTVVAHVQRITADSTAVSEIEPSPPPLHPAKRLSVYRPAIGS